MSDPIKLWVWRPFGMAPPGNMVEMRYINEADHLAALQAAQQLGNLCGSHKEQLGSGEYRDCLACKIEASEARVRWLEEGKTFLEQFLRQSVSPMEWKGNVKKWLAAEPKGTP